MQPDEHGTEQCTANVRAALRAASRSLPCRQFEADPVGSDVKLELGAIERRLDLPPHAVLERNGSQLVVGTRGSIQRRRDTVSLPLKEQVAFDRDHEDVAAAQLS